MIATGDTKSAALRVGVYIFFCAMTLALAGPLLTGLGGYFFGATATTFLAGWTGNFFALRIYERLPFTSIGLNWNPASSRNLALGLAGGTGAATFVLGGPLLVGVAHLQPALEPPASWSSFLFIFALLLVGAAGEEMLFRGYGLQVLLRSWGPYAAILPVGVLFAALHSRNPHATYVGLANTAGFGILFGYAFLRSRDLWLPIGLHFGWNLTLPLFGVNVSGFTMRLTGYTVQWNAGPLWSGGEYGPEASVMTSGVLAMMWLFLRLGPIQEQHNTLAALTVEGPSG